MPKSDEAQREVNLRMPEVRSTLVDVSVDADDVSADTPVPACVLRSIRIRLVPAATLFDTTTFDAEKLSRRCREQVASG